MHMSKGRMSCRWIGLAIIVIAACISGAAYAGLGQPSPWEMKLQDSATPVMDNIIWFHNFLLWLITAITLFVLALLVIVVVRFNAKANPVPSQDHAPHADRSGVDHHAGADPGRRSRCRRSGCCFSSSTCRRPT